MADRLFISHASEDEAVVNRIVAYLEARGVPCWISSRDIPPRSIYAEAITSGIRQGGACAVVISKAANESAAIKRELELASHYGKPFVPIRIDATEPGPGLDYYLRNTQWMDYKREGERALDRIVSHMAAGAAPIAYPQTPPRVPRSNNIVRLAMIAIAAVVLLGGGWVVWSKYGAHAERPTTMAMAPTADSGKSSAYIPPASVLAAEKQRADEAASQTEERRAPQPTRGESIDRPVTDRNSVIGGRWFAWNQGMKIGTSPFRPI